MLLAAQELKPPYAGVSPTWGKSRALTYLAGVHIWPIGLVVSLRPGWLPGCAVGGSADTAETFSSSLLLRQAALGFRFRSVTEKSEFLISHTLTPQALSIHEPWSKNSSAASPFSCWHPLSTRRCPKLQTITTESPARQLLNWGLKKNRDKKPSPFSSLHTPSETFKKHLLYQHKTLKCSMRPFCNLQYNKIEFIHFVGRLKSYQPCWHHTSFRNVAASFFPVSISQLLGQGRQHTLNG